MGGPGVVRRVSVSVNKGDVRILKFSSTSVNEVRMSEKTDLTSLLIDNDDPTGRHDAGILRKRWATAAQCGIVRKFGNRLAVQFWSSLALALVSIIGCSADDRISVTSYIGSFTE